MPYIFLNLILKRPVKLAFKNALNKNANRPVSNKNMHNRNVQCAYCTSFCCKRNRNCFISSCHIFLWQVGAHSWSSVSWLGPQPACHDSSKRLIVEQETLIHSSGSESWGLVECSPLTPFLFTHHSSAFTFLKEEIVGKMLNIAFYWNYWCFKRNCA